MSVYCQLAGCDEALRRRLRHQHFSGLADSIADGLFALAARHLKPQGVVAIYGPSKVDGGYTTETNASFDGEILAAGVAEWGLKDVRDLEKTAKSMALR